MNGLQAHIMLIHILFLLFNYTICGSKDYNGMFFFNFTIFPIDKQFSSQSILQFISDSNLCLGTPLVCKAVQFIPNCYLTFLLENSEKHNAYPNTTYNVNTSSTFEFTFQIWYGFADEIMYRGRLAKDKVQFGSIVLNEFKFYLAGQWSPEQKYSSIGLNVDLRQNAFPSFIKQLVNNEVITIEQYSIEFYDESKGRITFGNDSDSDSNGLVKYDKVIELQITNLVSPVIHYYEASDVHIGSNVIAKNVEIVFDEAFGFIQVGIDMKMHIVNNYLLDLNCKEETINLDLYRSKPTRYAHFICNKSRVEAKYSKGLIKDLVFSFPGGNLVFSKEEVFKDYDGKRVQLMIIVTEVNVSPQWVIGYPMLKRFKVVHNYADRTLALYSKQDVMTTPIKTINPIDNTPIFDNKNNGALKLLIYMSIMLSIGLVINVIFRFKIRNIHKSIMNDI